MWIIDRAPDIQTERLRLRAPEERDVAAVTQLAGDYAICSMTTRMPFPYAEEDARAFVRLTSQQDRRRDNAFVIEHLEEGTVGCIGFHQPENARLELGYWIGRPYWGRGFATEATCAALAWARDAWRRTVVTAGHFADNDASGQVLIKSGFLYTGEIQHRHSHARGAIAPTRMMVWLA
jgi:RimJ/RimL family protein N-acetyltransferase